jgi:hypothetical protein
MTISPRRMTSNRTILTFLPLVAVVGLNGCWTAPVATVQPKGEPRLIQDRVAVESVGRPATVQFVDARARTIVMQAPGEAGTFTSRAGPKVSNLDTIAAGDEVKATVAEELTIYVSRSGELPGADSAPKTPVPHAKVLSVDPSYRLLTLQYSNGRSEIFKVSRDVKLKQMEAGDDVLIRPIEVVALSLRKR